MHNALLICDYINQRKTSTVVLRENHPPRMSKSNGVISEPIEECLKEVMQKLDVRNYSIHLSEGSAKGKNFMGSVTKVKITGHNLLGEETVHNLVIKSAPSNETFRVAFSVPAAYEREIYVYEKVLREFDALQREKRVREPFQAYPKYYGSTMREFNESFIMEDLMERGFRLHNTKRPVDYDHAQLVLREYAKFHALSFAMRLHKPEVFRELSENTQQNLFTGFEFASFHRAVVERSKKIFMLIDPIQEKSLYEKYEKFHGNMVHHVKSILRSDLSNSQCVISHGDCWINNFLFKYDSSEDCDKPLGVRILDWQASCYGSPALDMGYFIFICTDKDLRDKHYSDLIEIYYRTFSDFLTALGGDPQQQFPFEALQEHLKKYSVFGLYLSFLTLLVITSDIHEIPDFSNIVKEDDIVTALMYDSKNFEMYNRRVKDILVDFERLGYNF